MSLFLVTGLPGTGKSTICAELKRRGYKAYDGDYDHLAKWYNNSTNKPIDESRGLERTTEFLHNHSRNISRRIVEDLAFESKDKVIFLCADPENEDDLVDLFERVYALTLDEDARQQRLAERTNNQWGKLPHEIAYDLDIKPTAYNRYKKSMYHTIDASQPVKLIVSHILNELNNNLVHSK